MVRLLIADDHRIFREGLARLLRDHSDLDVVAEAGNDQDVMSALYVHRPDMAVLDLSMPGRDGVDLIAHIKATYPQVKILIITMQSSDVSALRSLRAGADGYITKDNAATEVTAAIRQIMRGTRYVCPVVAERLALGAAGNASRKEAHECLSEREFKIFEMLVAGKRGADIASELSLSEKTVSTHKANVLRKLDLHSGSDLVRYAIRHQLVTA
jgi:DNA-binding NarL/FixJ family response regulator